MIIGIDLGGTKIEGVVLDDRGTEIYRRRLPTPQGDYSGTLEVVATLVNEARTHAGDSARVGIGTPGAVSSATGLMKNCNSVCLNGKPLVTDLERCLGASIVIANDADCFALSEARDGAGSGADTIFGVIIGTGTGGGIVSQGRPLRGPNSIAGEWGHNPLPWPHADELPGSVCYCGRRGCIETFLSGSGMAADYGAATGVDLPAVEIVSLADRGDVVALATLDRYIDRLARSLATVINILDPHVVVLGGGLSNIDAIYTELPGRLGSYVFSDRVDTSIRKAIHGDSSGVRGAAWLAAGPAGFAER